MLRKHSESTHWSIYKDIPQDVSWAGYQIIASQPQSHPFWLFGENASGSFKYFFLCQLYQWAGLQRRGRRMVSSFWAPPCSLDSSSRGRWPAVPRGQQILPTDSPVLGPCYNRIPPAPHIPDNGIPWRPRGQIPRKSQAQHHSNSCISILGVRGAS